MTKKHIVITICLAAVLMIMLAPDTYARKSLHDVRTWVYIHETEAHGWDNAAIKPHTEVNSGATRSTIYISLSCGNYFGFGIIIIIDNQGTESEPIALQPVNSTKQRVSDGSKQPAKSFYKRTHTR